MLSRTIIGGLFVTLASSPSWAIASCLTELESLVQRADTVVVGRITAVHKAKRIECQEGGADEGKAPRCEGLFTMDVVVSDALKGTAPQKKSILVGPDGPLVLQCDDRPPVGGMKGLSVVLFLERYRDEYWTLDGPNSIYVVAAPGGRPDDTVTRVRQLIEVGD